MLKTFANVFFNRLLLGNKCKQLYPRFGPSSRIHNLDGKLIGVGRQWIQITVRSVSMRSVSRVIYGCAVQRELVDGEWMWLSGAR
jgi:hypothetical protein